MKAKSDSAQRKRLELTACTARELMTPNPISIQQSATVREAAALMTDQEISAVPVIDGAGRAVGVLTRTDIVRHDREATKYLTPDRESYSPTERTLPSGESLADGFQIESTDSTRVRDIMTPAILSVSPDASVVQVISEMLAYHVHHLFVVDRGGVPIGVISTFDFLRKLSPPNHPTA
jgi:CBS domain-containing protein